MVWSVMVFAAGFGTRMKHLTQDQPKPMIKVAGRPLIDHALKLTEGLPAAQTVVNLHYKPEALEKHLFGRSIQTVLESPKILDTGGGLRNALPLLGQTTVMTLTSDAVWHGPNPLQALAEAWDPDRMDGLLMCIRPDHAVGHLGAGDFLPDAEGRITRGPGVIYTGAQMIKTDRRAEITDDVFSLNGLWDMMIAENSLYAIEYDGRWCDVGHPGGIAEAEAMLQVDDV